MDPSSISKSKRGAFQPRGDLQNRSPEDEDNDEKPSHSNPSLPPSIKSKNATTKQKKANYLPVKSSGYGRASPSVKMSISSSRPKLRHGDGSLAGERTIDKQKARRSTSRSSSMLSANATATKNYCNSGKSRQRSASPAVRNMRSKNCPSPAVGNSQKEEHHQQHRLNDNKRHHDDKRIHGLPLKKQKNQENFSKSFASPESKKNYREAETISQNIDIDPTPVKAAKKLLSDAKKQAAVMEHTPLSPLIQSPVMEEETIDCEVAKADTDPSVLQSADGNFSTSADSNGSVSSMFTDLHPSISQTQSLSDNLFSIQSGIASTSILSLIKTKNKSSSSAAAPSDLRKRLERSEEELKTLKTICNDLLKGKDEFVAGAVRIELALRQKSMGVQTSFRLLGEEKETLTKQLNGANDTALKMQEELECLGRERDLAKAKCNALQDDCDGAKRNLEALQQKYTDSCVKMALLETKLEESKSQLEEARCQVIEAQSFTEKAVDDAKVELSIEVNKLKEKNETMVAMMKAREIEVCKLMDFDLESVNFDDGSSFLNAIRSKVEEYRHDANTTIEHQNELERLKAELKQSKTDLCVSFMVYVICHRFNCFVSCKLNKILLYVPSVCTRKSCNKRQRYE